MHFKKKIIMRKGGAICHNIKGYNLLHEKEDHIKTNMIVGKLMKPVLQNQIADKTPNPNLVGGDIMDFNKIVKRNTKTLQNKKDNENIKFIY